jgi:hypothetical protein
MPTLDCAIPDSKPKQNIRREMRGRRLITYELINFIPQSLKHLNRAQIKGDKLLKESDAKDFPAIVSALCKIVDQRRVLLRIPGPPPGAPGKNSLSIQPVIEAEPVFQPVLTDE